MFRFTIRDLLWLMVVVGLAVGWWIDNKRIEKRLAGMESDSRLMHAEYEGRLEATEEIYKRASEVLRKSASKSPATLIDP